MLLTIQSIGLIYKESFLFITLYIAYILSGKVRKIAIKPHYGIFISLNYMLFVVLSAQLNVNKCMLKLTFSAFDDTIDPPKKKCDVEITQHFVERMKLSFTKASHLLNVCHLCLIIALFC